MISVIIPASGAGLRFGAVKPKQFLDLKGRQILWHTISVFQNINEVDEIAVAVPQGYASEVEHYGFNKVKHIVEGGESRAHSVFTALKKLSPHTKTVLIHDGVRPFVTEDIIKSVATQAKIYGAAIACIPITDTIKKAGPQGKITETLDRNQLWSVQTPQGFTYDIITNAYYQAEKDGTLAQVTDDSSLVERLKIPVHIVHGSPRNIKITTSTDFHIAETFILERTGC